MKTRLLSSALIITAIFTAKTTLSKENVNSAGIVIKNNPYREMQANCAPATSQSDLDINNVRVKVLNGGDMWWDLFTGSYFVPKPAAGTRGVSAMYAASLWIGGYDGGGSLKVAAQTYRQSGNDFWPGPLNSAFSTDASTCLQWDKHFLINRSDVEEFNAWYEGKSTGSYTIPKSILEWPTISNEGKPMAPYHDYDGDGTYNPMNGDYPDFDIKGTKGCNANLYGDQAIWWVFNDKGDIHTSSGGTEIGLEIHAQAFAFKTNDEINNMSFYKYTIINKSKFKLDSTFFGVWCDSDLGGATDDFVGCDVEAGLGYSYNGDLVDGPAAQGELVYGNNPPAVGIDFFEGPFANPDGIDNSSTSVPASFTNYGDGIVDNERLGMARFLYYNNDWTDNGNPGNQGAPSPVNMYQYLSGSWQNGQAVTYGGNGVTGSSTPCKYMFPGDSDPKGWGTAGIPQLPWSEYTAGNKPDDRRFLQSAGPFTLQPGAKNTITIGVPWARATQGGNLASIGVLKGADEKAQELFKNCFKTLDGPTAPELTIQELDKELILYWTNPSSSNNFNENYVEDYDLTSNADVPYTFQGYMVYQLKDAFVSTTDLYDVNKARLIFQCDVKDNVSQIVNYYNDASISALVPQEMVNGANSGIAHSLKVNEDMFATGNKQLVNHKTYYYTIIAYGYSKTKDAPNFSVKKDYLPFLAGRKQAGGQFAYSAIPHIITPEMAGTEQNSFYGYGPKMKRIEGQGNGGNVLDLTEETVTQILNSPSSRVENPVYENSKGPVKITVVDPLNVPVNNDFRFILKPKYPTTLPNSFTSVEKTYFINIPQDSSSWELHNLTTGQVITSDKTLKYGYEQIINGQPSGSTSNVIPKWGLSVTVKFVKAPGPTYDTTVTAANGPKKLYEYEINNGFLEASMTFMDNSKRWLTGVQDQDGETHLNWIRAGSVENSPITPFDDFKDQDNEQQYEKALNGTWAPYRLCAYTTPAPANQTIKYIGGPAFKDYHNNVELRNISSVDVVLTSDSTKWTRCPVIEMQEEAALAIGGALKLNRRKSPSVDKQGKKAGEAGYNTAEGDLNGTQGMGWFPGYAINVETGERLNMAFGEDSWLANENGADMLWNPTSSVMGFGGVPLFGGKHYIYVFGHNGDAKYSSGDAQMANKYKDVPRYDEGATLSDMFKAVENTVGGISNIYKKEIYFDAMWVNIPLVASGHQLLETDVKIRLRVGKQYAKGLSGSVFPLADLVSNPINDNYSVYEFNTRDIGTAVNDNSIAKNALDLINVVPNPYYAYSAYEQNTLQNIVKITNLPHKCKISIYTLNGNLIRTFNKDEPKTSLDWDLKNQKRIPIASGMYIIHVDAEGIGEKTLKWFGVLRPIDLESF